MPTWAHGAPWGPLGPPGPPWGPLGPPGAPWGPWAHVGTHAISLTRLSGMHPTTRHAPMSGMPLMSGMPRCQACPDVRHAPFPPPPLWTRHSGLFDGPAFGCFILRILILDSIHRMVGKAFVQCNCSERRLQDPFPSISHKDLIRKCEGNCPGGTRAICQAFLIMI